MTTLKFQNQKVFRFKQTGYVWLLFCLFFCFGKKQFAQEYPLIPTLEVNPDITAYVEDWLHVYSIVLHVQNETNASIEFCIQAEMFNETGSLVAETGSSPTFIAFPGLTPFLPAQFFILQHFNFYEGIDVFVQNEGQLPSGVYFMCFRLVDKNGLPLSDEHEGCGDVVINACQNPIPVYPEGGLTVSTEELQFIDFQLYWDGPQDQAIEFIFVKKEPGMTDEEVFIQKEPDFKLKVFGFEIINIPAHFGFEEGEYLWGGRGCDDFIQVDLTYSNLTITQDQQEPEPPIIVGYKFNDLNGNGSWEGHPPTPGEEPGIENYEIKLEGPNGTQTTTTNKNGRFEFVVTEPGQYTLSESLQAGWTATTPTSYNIIIRLFEGETFPEFLFGNRDVEISFCKLEELPTEKGEDIVLRVDAFPENEIIEYGAPILLHAQAWDFDYKPFRCKPVNEIDGVEYSNESYLFVPLRDEVYYKWEVVLDEIRLTPTIEENTWVDIGANPNTKGNLISKGGAAVYFPPYKSMIHYLIRKKFEFPKTKYVCFSRKIIIKCTAYNNDSEKFKAESNEKLITIMFLSNKLPFDLKLKIDINNPITPISLPEVKYNKNQCKISYSWERKPKLDKKGHDISRVFKDSPSHNSHGIVRPGELLFYTSKERDFDELIVECDGDVIRKKYEDPIETSWVMLQSEPQFDYNYSSFALNKDVIFKMANASISTESKACYRVSEFPKPGEEIVRVEHLAKDKMDFCVQGKDSPPEKWWDNVLVKECEETFDSDHKHYDYSFMSPPKKCGVHNVKRYLFFPDDPTMRTYKIFDNLEEFFCTYDGYCFNNYVSLGDLTLVAPCFNKHVGTPPHSYDHEIYIDPEYARSQGASALYINGLLSPWFKYDRGDIIFEKKIEDTDDKTIWHEVIHALQDYKGLHPKRHLEIDTWFMSESISTLWMIKSFEDYLRKGCNSIDAGEARLLWDKAMEWVYDLNNNLNFDYDGQDASTPIYEVWVNDFFNYAGFKIEWEKIFQGFLDGMCHDVIEGIPIRRLLPEPPEEIFPLKKQPISDHRHKWDKDFRGMGPWLWKCKLCGEKSWNPNE